MQAKKGPLGFLGHLDGISLKIENIGHGFHLLSHTSLPRQSGYALQRRFIQHSTQAALIKPETGWLATGNPHRQPPTTYGAHQSRNSSTPPSKRAKRHDQPAPSTQPLMMNYLIRNRSSDAD